MRSRLFSACNALLLLCVSILAFTSLFLKQEVSAQSPNCHGCIQRSIPKVVNCTTLTPGQLTTLDSLIHGRKLYNTVGIMNVKEPAVFQCLVALMWDIVYYKATLWDQCLDPGVGCPWGEMMHYFEMIPKIASIYGATDLPAAILIDGPK